MIVLVTLGCSSLTVRPAIVSGAQTCRVADALEARNIAATYAARKRYADAAQWFTAAAESTRDCARPGDALLDARSLLQAGAAFARNGDYLRALDLEAQTRRRLTTISATRRPGAADAQAMLTQVDDLVKAIDTVAQASI